MNNNPSHYGQGYKTDDSLTGTRNCSSLRQVTSNQSSNMVRIGSDSRKSIIPPTPRKDPPQACVNSSDSVENHPTESKDVKQKF